MLAKGEAVVARCQRCTLGWRSCSRLSADLSRFSSIFPISSVQSLPIRACIVLAWSCPGPEDEVRWCSTDVGAEGWRDVGAEQSMWTCHVTGLGSGDLRIVHAFSERANTNQGGWARGARAPLGGGGARDAASELFQLNTRKRGTRVRASRLRCEDLSESAPRTGDAASPAERPG